jgi:hypothetical protein
MKRSWSGRRTRKRVGEMHTCPALRNLAAAARSAVRSTSASSKTSTGACPPSSSVVGLTCRAASAPTVIPTGVEPVSDTLRMTGEAISVSEIRAGSPNTTLTAPGGKPAASSASTIASAVAGVSSDGLMTQEQPAASAAASLRVGPVAGKFQGVNAATGPTGSRRAR